LLLPYLPATLALIDALWQLRAARHTDGPILVACAVVIAMLVVRQVIVLLDNRVLVAKVTHQAFHDELTGLANRALFNDRLAHALDLHRRDLRPLALLLIDLDEFKRVNDTLGHPAGDELLTRVGERLLVTARRGDTVARLGGDEFTILMEDNNDALLVASRLLEALDTPVSIAGRQVTIRASIGITTIRATDPTMSATEMFKQADLALYAAKGAGKAMIATYHPGLDHPEAEADDPNLWDTVPTTAS
jgi:diguanylate cyclase